MKSAFWGWGMVAIALVGCAKVENKTQAGEFPLVCDEVCYQVIEGRAVFQGDIVLGYVDGDGRKSLTMSPAYKAAHYWNGGVVPYRIDPALPNPARIQAAIDHYHQKTAIKLVPWTNQADYVTFRPINSIACFSALGRSGGQQFIDLDANCGTQEVIHEIGHAIGLWHEQGRSDRDNYINIVWNNIDPTYKFAFDKVAADGQDVGPYDFHSIMHYHPYSFSKDGTPTITRKNGAIDIGPQGVLSAGDIDGIINLYGGSAPPSGDVFLTGIKHVIAAAPASGMGKVKVWNADTQQLVGELNPFPGFAGGASVAVGDINGDGTLDVATAAGNGGGPRVVVFDGKTGKVMRDFFPYDGSFRGGVFVALGDVNGDGADDIVTGTGVGGGPHVTVFDGRSGVSIASFFAYESSFRGGVLVAAGDINGDGRAEIITGTGPGGGPRVVVFRIDNGTPSTVHNFFAYEESFRGGVKVGAGDLDGDGRADILTGTGVGGGPRVTGRNGLNPNAIHSNFFAGSSSSRAGVNVAATKIGGRGVWVTGAGPWGSPLVQAYDVTGALLWQADLGYGNTGANVAGR